MRRLNGNTVRNLLSKQFGNSGLAEFAKVAWRSSRVLSTVVVASVLLAALTPLASVVAIGQVVAAVPSSAAWQWAIAAGVFFVLQFAFGSLQGAAATSLGERVDAVLQRDLMRAVLTPPGIAHLEDPAKADLINVGRETYRGGSARPGRLAATTARLLAGRALLLGSCVLVAGFHLALGLAFLVAGLLAAYADKVASRTEATRHLRGSELARRTDYYYGLGVNPPAAKEIRVFGLSGFLLSRFDRGWSRSMIAVLTSTDPGLPREGTHVPRERALVSPARRPLLAAIALGLVVLGGVAWIARSAAVGEVGAGPAVVYIQALMAGIGALQSSSWAGLQTELSLATLRRYRQAVATLAAREGTHVPRVHGCSLGGDISALSLPQRAIRFERVSFSYQGADRRVLDELDLEIPAGRSLAIVGANGAGKTTLTKLLCDLYEPTAGRITIDGVDLRDVETREWHRRIAVVFQDTTRFPVTARSNIAFGRIDAADDLGPIERAAASAGADDAIRGLANGWETVLSPEYAEGADLSGGQWQKVGLARALFAVDHGASVLILDEPAAHLDARSEARLYERFLELTRGLTTVVISHRFSTVRQADSIAVVEGGRVTELGAHDDLMAADGAYAEMFRLQASAFQTATTAGSQSTTTATSQLTSNSKKEEQR